MTNHIHMHTKNHTYFQKINTQNKAYILGFICADGSIHTKKGNLSLGIELQKRDKDVLSFIKKEINYNGPFYRSYHKNKEYCKLKIYGKEFVSHIINHGLDNQKTYNLEMPKSIPKNLIRHFIRGLFDGDGCLSITKRPMPNGHLKDRWKLSIMCTQKMGNFIIRYSKQELGINFFCTHSITQKHTIMSYIYLEKYDDINLFLQHIYKNHNFCLKRKYDLYLKLKKIKKRNELKVAKTKKLTSAQVQDIKQRLKNRTETYRAIAKDYNVSHGVIQSIERGKCYQNVC